MRIALFSDIHANLPALEVVLEHVLKQKYDAVYCLGDLGGYAAQPNEVQEAVMAFGCPTVLGNYDEGVGYELEDCGCQYVKPFDIAMSQLSFQWTRENTSQANKAWLRKLPREIRVEVEGQQLLICHGSPRSNKEYLFENRSEGYLRQFTRGGKYDAHADILLFGHTHVPYHRVVEGVHFINTGSVGRPKDGDPRAGYCALTVKKDEIQVTQIRLTYDVEATCRLLEKAGLPAYFAEYLRTGGKVQPPPYEQPMVES